jgi:hypothetical protein
MMLINPYKHSPSYSSAAQTVFANMDSDPPSALKTAMADFIDSQVTAGNWDKIIDYVRLDMDTEANALSSWKGVVTPQFVGAHWAKYSDVLTQGTTSSYIKSGFIPNNVPAFTLNNCGFGVGIRANNEPDEVDAKCLFGNFEAAGTNRQLSVLQLSTSSNIQYRASTSSSSTTTAITDFADHSFYAVEKKEAALIGFIQNATQLDTNAITNGALSQIEVYIGCRNNDGVADTPLDAHYRYYIIYNPVGFDYTSFYNNVVILNNAIDALIAFLPLVIKLGQSNESGRAETNRMAALTAYSTSLSSARIYKKATHDTTANGDFEHLIPGDNNIDIGLTASYNLFGSEVSLATNIFNNHGLPTFWINAARGGTNLATDWDETAVGSLYDIAVDAYILPCISKLQALYPGKTIKPVICWQQGETETDTANYLTNLQSFFTALRAEHSLLNTAPLFITKLYYNVNATETSINANFDTYAATANTYVFNVASQVTYPRKIDLPSGVRTTYPATLADDNHNSYEFQIKKGELHYAKLVEIGYI